MIIFTDYKIMSLQEIATELAVYLEIRTKKELDKAKFIVDGTLIYIH